VKRIGIPAQSFNDNHQFGVSSTYAEFLRHYGRVIILFPDQIEELDLLVLPGGNDVYSGRYGEVPNVMNTRTDPFLEYFDMNTLSKYIEKQTPIFGICRGLQTLNVHFGGKLVQNTIWHPYSTTRDDRVHEIHQDGEYPQLPKKLKVNSLHHQAVMEKVIAPAFRTIFYSKDGIIEALTHKSLPIKAVQWHPEEIYDPISRVLIMSLLGGL
jgi:putative glutamine amidotransferase